MVIRKENQRLQVRDNVRGGNGTLENRHIIEPDAMFGSATLFTEFFFDPGDSIGAHPHAIENRSDKPAKMLAVILKV